MFQRGLAILLSVCMLAGGISETAYAMSPQSAAETVDAAQDISNTGTGAVLQTEKAADDPKTEDGESPAEDQAENGVDSANNGDGTGSSSEVGGTEEGTDGAGSGSSDGGSSDSDDKETGDGTGSGDNTTTDGTDTGDNTAEDGTGGSGNTTTDGTDSDGDSEEDAILDGTEEDDNTAENGSDTTVSGNDADVEDGSSDGTDMEMDTSKSGMAVSNVKEEELLLTVDSPQTVTLAEAEKQWLSFTAPQDGLYHFYSTAESSDYQGKRVYLFHEKSDNEYDYFEQDYASGQNGNFSYTYRMQADETVYLRVEFTDSTESGTFTVHAEKTEVPELTVTKNDEGSYALQSDSYQLNLVFTPSYSTVKAEMELRQADGSALTGYNSYKVYYQYSYDTSWGSQSGSNDCTEYFYSSSDYKVSREFTNIASGGELLITELQIRDSSNNILAALGTGGQEISVYTLTTDKQGVLTQVTAEDASISVRPEIIGNHNARLRYRKAEESEWTYYKNTIYYYNSAAIMLAAEPDTDYVIELTATDLEMVYDTAEIRTKAFAASDIHTEVTNITSSGATIKVTVGMYTGSNQYIRARVSYTDSMGEAQTDTGYLYASNIETGSINLTLRNLAAGTEYKDLQVELDDTDDYSMQYAAYRTNVSFTTAASALTTEQIDVTVTPDAEDGTQAVLKVALQDVTEGSYPYTVKYRVAGSKDWQDGKSKTGSLSASNSYADEQNLTSLMGNTEYEVLVMVDGISKSVSFTTTSAAVAATVEVQPLMSGVQVTAALTGREALSGSYSVSAQYYDQDAGRWQSTSYIDYSSTQLTEYNNWAGTTVLYSANIRPNAVNDWKISISGGTGKVYEQYFSLKAVRQEISMAAERIMCTTAQIRAVLAARDESIRYASAELYYRAKATSQWIDAGTCYYYNEDGDTVYLNGLKEDTEYEVKLVPEKYPEDILAQAAFRTLKDTRTLAVSVDNCRYTSAQVNWTFDSGENVLDSSSYVCLYYRKKSAAAWNFLNSRWQSTTATGKVLLTDLEPGTSYEVLAEIKDSSASDAAGQNVVREVKESFETVAVDHELAVETVEAETAVTSVGLAIKLTKKTGELENRAKAAVTLESADGSDTQSKTVYLNKDNGYTTKLKVNGLLPGTKYTVSAKLYESENNTWVFLKNFDLGDVTTAEAKAPTALTISEQEQELVLNKGTSKKLTVTVQPQEAAAGLIWSSSDETIATVGRNGTVTARKVGEADITVSAAGEADSSGEKVSAVSHVTVRDYEIRVKNADGSYDSMPGLLSKAQKRTLVVYDHMAGQDLPDITWSSSNPNAARISEDGVLEPQNYGRAYITASTAEGIILKKGPIKVVNEIQGFSITRPETDNDSYRAIRTAEAVYQVAAGETYQVGCVLSPAYTDQYDSTVSMEGDRFTWSSDHSAVTAKVSSYDSNLTEITIPESVSGQVKVTAVMKDEEYKDKSFTITLDVLKKPEVTVLPDTYTWLDYSSKLKDAALPENWQWKEQDTLIYEAGMKTFTARYVQSDYYPYETGVTVRAERIGNNLSVLGDYSTVKKAYVVKTGTPLKVSINALGGSIPTLLYEQSALTPAAKDAAKVTVSEPDETGYYGVTASANGTYTVSAAVSLKKAAFEKKNGGYVLTAGAPVKSTAASVKFMAVGAAPIQKITFAVAEDSPEKVTFTKEGTIEYEITAANADTKNNERVIYIDVTATDTDGNVVENPNINYAVSDAAVVKQKKDSQNRLVLTIPRGADGLAKIVATAKDELGSSAQFAVRVKDYTPRVTTVQAVINENFMPNCTKALAEVVLPYEEEEGDTIERAALVKTNGGTDAVAGLEIAWNTNGGNSSRNNIYLRIRDKDKIEKTGSLNYYLAITTKAYGGTVFVPVKIKIETGPPAVSLKQSGKVNVFYTDTTHLSVYDAISMGLVEISTVETIESVRWVAGDDSAPNTEFVIERAYTTILKNGKYTKKYMIQQHRPTLNSAKKPSDDAAKGNLYVRLRGYQDEIELPFTVQTVYKKPKLKAADYKVCPTLGEVTDYQYIYTNAAKSNNYLVKGSSSVWKGYSDVVCADEEIEIVENSDVALRYSGSKDKKTQLTLYSDYWYESLSVPVKVKVAKSKVKLSPATVTLNTAYPSETTQTAAVTGVYNAATGSMVNMSDVRIEGANAQAQQILDQSLINIDYMNARLTVSLNYANAMGISKIKPGSYKYKLTPYYGDAELNSVTLSVKIIDKEATVKVKAKGTIDLLKLNWDGNGYDNYSNNSVIVTSTFKNLDSSYQVMDAQLEGAYKDMFRIGEWLSGGSFRIVPSSVGQLKAGKSYSLSITYTVRDVYGEGGETITLQSNTFTIKPKQSVPKVTTSVKQLRLYACAKGEDKAERMYLYVPHEYKKGYYAIQNASGSLDVNKDGKADLMVKTLSISKSSGRAEIAVYVQDADAVKATAKGVAYKIPVTVRCVGRDGVSKDATVNISVVVKK